MHRPIKTLRRQRRDAKEATTALADSDTALAVADQVCWRKACMAELCPQTKAIERPDPRRHKNALLYGYGAGLETHIRPVM